jgi:hypothetical protein
VSRFESLFFHLAAVLVGGTGVVYAWMVYLVQPSDPYARVNHPLQPQVQHLHVLAAPLLVFAAGLIWRRHIWASLRSGVRQRRRSGVGLALTLVPMIASGYLLQTAVDPPWRRAWSLLHLVASALWLLGYLAHQLQWLRRPKRIEGLRE